MLILHKVEFKGKKITRYNDDRRMNSLEDVKILNVYLHNKRASKDVIQKLIALTGEIGKSAVRFEDSIYRSQQSI